MKIQIEKLTELQASLGYKFNGEINPVALLGLFGESAEVLHEAILMKTENKKVVYTDELSAACSIGAIIDNIKKKIRKNKEQEIEVLIHPDNLDAFDLEVADTLYYLNIIATNRGKTLGDYAELAFNKVSGKMQNKPVPELPKQEVAIKNSELFSDYFKEAEYNLLEVMNKIIERNKGIHESDNYTSGEFLVLEVLINEEGDELLQLVPNIEAYMAVCRQMFNTSEGDNIFCFSLAVDFHQRYFNTWIYYDSEAECYYDKNND